MKGSPWTGSGTIDPLRRHFHPDSPSRDHLHEEEQGMIESQERVTTHSRVEVRSAKLRTNAAQSKIHLHVSDILKFATELNNRNVPLNKSVEAVLLDKDSSLLFSLGVYWSTDLINGEPAPQAVEKTEP